MLKFLWSLPVCMFYIRNGLRLFLVVAMLFFCTVMLRRFESARYQMSPIQRQIGERLVEDAVERFPWSGDGIGQVRLVSDSDKWEYFQDAIREKVARFNAEGSRKFDIVPDGFWKRLGRTFGIGQTTRTESIDSIRRKMKEDALLLVHFDGLDYAEDPTNAVGRLTCTFFGKPGTPPRVVTSQAVYRKPGRLLGRAGLELQGIPFARRLFYAILAVLLFPFVMSPLTVTVLRRRSARANAFMMLAYIAAALAFEWMLWGPPAGTAQAVLLCLWSGAVVWYLLMTGDYLASRCSDR